MQINLGLTAKSTAKIALELNRVLADEFVLATKTHNYHWNIEGSNFMEMHKFYEGMYNELDETVDEVAERIRSIGHYAEGRLKDYIKLTHLDEPEYSTDQKTQLGNLLSDHEIVIKNLRKLITIFQDDCKDAGSADFVTGLLEKHEKMAWFIRSYLK